MRKITIAIAALLFSGISFISQGRHGDTTESPNLTVENPIIWADVPDPDVIRVGDDFYMVSTTMHLMPGCPVMHSKDLVNWETIGYVFDRLEDTPRYDLQDGTVYGKGQWATSLRYRDGIYYLLFSPNDEPFKSYIYSATDPAGEWKLIARSNHFHDASLLLDDDGRVYVFHGSGDIHLQELKADLSGVKEDGVNAVVIHPDADERGLHEGSRVIKHNGKYYAFVISWPQGKPRRQLCYRSDKITGPYEKMVVLESEFGGFPYVGQGCLVDDADGNWWGVIFQDRGGVGRILTLNPATWINGWPMLGDSLGHVPATIGKKVVPLANAGVVQSDDFNDGCKNILWEWNHNPDDSLWSLDERPGWLRLHTGAKTDNAFVARNTITQRMEGPKCEGTVKLDISGMKKGDCAGFAAWNGDAGLLTITDLGDGKRHLKAQSSSVAIGEPNHSVTGVTTDDIESVPLDGNDLWLRINADFRPGSDMATFAYSTDGNNWNTIGKPFKMKFDYLRFFMGTRFAIFNYSTTGDGGYIDVDSFNYRKINRAGEPQDSHTMTAQLP